VGDAPEVVPLDREIRGGGASVGVDAVQRAARRRRAVGDQAGRGVASIALNALVVTGFQIMPRIVLLLTLTVVLGAELTIPWLVPPPLLVPAITKFPVMAIVPVPAVLIPWKMEAALAPKIESF
jgi:hypothetical protein